MAYRYLMGAVLVAVLSFPAMAQFAPMPLYQHPVAGQPDPYAMWPSCCSGKDCVPWDGNDIEVTVNGYYIRSLDVEVTEQRRIKPSFNGQYHVCKPMVQGSVREPFYEWDPKGKRHSFIYCLFVPMGM